MEGDACICWGAAWSLFELEFILGAGGDIVLSLSDRTQPADLNDPHRNTTTLLFTSLHSVPSHIFVLE